MKKFKEDEELSQYSSSDIICATGQRVPESTRRSGNMIKQNTANKNIEDLMAEFKASEVKTDYKLYLYAPIRELETDDVFNIWSPLAVFRANNKKVLPKFLHYYLMSPNFKSLVEVSWSYGTQQNIGMGVLSNLPISYSNIKEQTQIANYLDAKTIAIDKKVKDTVVGVIEDTFESR